MDLNFVVLPGAEITTAELTIGPPDAENQVFDVGDRPYAEGDQVWDSGKSYRSLVDANNADLTDPASWEDEGEVDQGAIKWTAGTYAEDDYIVHNSVLWKSAANSNTDEPSDTSLKWTNYGPTNRFKAFDTVLDDSAMGVTKMKFVLEIPSRVTEMVLLKPIAGTVTITVTSASAGHSETTVYRGSRDSGGRWWRYFNTPIRRVSSIIVPSLAPYTDAVITIELESSEGAAVGIGQIIAGFGQGYATVTTGTGVGMASYSIKETNEFGRSIIVGYPPAKIVNFAVKIPTLQVDDFAEALFEREAKPTAFYMRDGSAYGTVVYGLFDDFYIDHQTSVIADSVIAIQGFS